MAVVIGQIVTETVLGDTAVGSADLPSGTPGSDEAHMEAIVRRATERVLETLRREWDR